MTLDTQACFLTWLWRVQCDSGEMVTHDGGSRGQHKSFLGEEEAGGLLGDRVGADSRQQGPGPVLFPKQNGK